MQTATLEDLVYGRLAENEELASLLAVYGSSEAPAVFYMKAPDDTAAGWNHREQYPRIDYTLDLQANPERHSNGVLTVDIWCTEDGRQPEEIEPVVRKLLYGVFLRPDGSYPFSFSWVRSDMFDAEKAVGNERGSNILNGVTMTFDVFAFPDQITTDPDPVLAIDEYVRELAPEALVISGDKEVPNVFEPAADKPIFYFRLGSTETYRETNTVVWPNGTLVGHLFAAGEEVKWMRALVNQLSLDGEATMLDKSPMFIRSVKADSTLDALSQGQLRISVRYGLLRRRPYVHTLFNANRDYQRKEGESNGS